MNSISVLLEIGIGLIISKGISIFIEPSRMDIAANLRNFLTPTESIVILGFQNEIVKYAVKNKDNELGLNRVISAVFLSLISVSVV